jgi:hypothetical protein
MIKSIEQLESERFQWSLKTFPNATAESSLIKAKRELKEAIMELDIYKAGVKTPLCKDKLAKEYVDTIMCIFDSAARAGISVTDIRDAYAEKLAINKSRKWIQNPDRTYSHVK